LEALEKKRLVGKARGSETIMDRGLEECANGL